MKLGDVFPDFEADTSGAGKIKFHDWLGDSWAILFSHPADYTPVCTTELGMVAKRAGDFAKKGVKLIALSCDSVKDHEGWGKDVMAYIGEGKKGDCNLPFPIIADEERKLAVQLGMVDPDERTATGLPLTCRAVFIIGPDKKLKLSLLYPATTGRNFDEILRVVDSLQLTATKKVATPVDWKEGDEAMVVPSLKPEEAEKMFPGHRKQDVPSGKGYLRFTKKYR